METAKQIRNFDFDKITSFNFDHEDKLRTKNDEKTDKTAKPWRKKVPESSQEKQREENDVVENPYRRLQREVSPQKYTVTRSVDRRFGF
ncbi:hypothetical protein L484_006600 [Morus notabilis]|uniref:Uncharacterized protein n=1 Tax=Morus notabilis TaxID=981085 RepID=W9S8R6_9ROSA|nr:hypothetical protein L484_006600 [Morus notabilis]